MFGTHFSSDAAIYRTAITNTEKLQCKITLKAQILVIFIINKEFLVTYYISVKMKD